jgi:serine O-acetyltransferase
MGSDYCAKDLPQLNDEDFKCVKGEVEVPAAQAR